MIRKSKIDQEYKNNLYNSYILSKLKKLSSIQSEKKKLIRIYVYR